MSGLLGIPQYAHAQTSSKRTVTGRVVDADGNAPLVGASVTIKGTNIGTVVLNSDATYTLTYDSTQNPNPVLEIQFLGYTTISERVNGRSAIDVSLKAANNVIDELVVVGYGTARKETLTGSVASVSNADIETTKTASFAAALAGKIPGLLIKQTDGMPGAFSTTISVRGQGAPMFVIDGVVRNDATEFQKLSPEDVESVSVLKDASAAIYGINSSNGVIIVTTKKGSKGEFKVTYNGNVGMAMSAKQIETLNTRQYWANIQQLRFLNQSGNQLSKETLEKNQAQPYVNWHDAVFKQIAVSDNHNVSISSGNDKIQGYVNIGYQDENGLLRSDDLGYDKYSMRGSLVFTPNDNWRIEASVSGRKDKRSQPGTWNDSFFYLMKSSHGMIPSTPIYVNDDPNYPYMPELGYDNPVASSRKENIGYRTWAEMLLQSQLSIQYALPWVKGLKIKAMFAYDMKYNNNIMVQRNFNVYRPDKDGNPYVAKVMIHNAPYMQDEASMFERVFFQGMLMYNRTFNDKHKVDAVLAFEGRSEPYHYLRGKRLYEGSLYTQDMLNMLPTKGLENGGNTNLKRYLSLVGRFNYAYKEKYLAEFAFRYDGSYRYAPEQRWGFFPVGSVGWRISEESFIKDNASWITNLKIRASYGVSAEDAGNAYQYLPGWGYGGGYVMDDSGDLTTGFNPTALENHNLTWVQSKIADIGIDINLWRDKLSFSLDFYRKDRTGLVATRSGGLPNHIGASLPQENLNADRNVGFDLVISHANQVGDFRYNVSFNLFMNRWKPIKVQRAPFRSSYDQWRNGSAGRWGDIGWGYEDLGQFQNEEQIRNAPIETTGNWANYMTYPGDYIHRDVNGNGWIDSGDMMPIFWTGKPKTNYGLVMGFGWKGLDFNMVWNGGSNYTVKYTEILAQVNGDANIPSMYDDKWKLKDPYDVESGWNPGKYPASHTNGTSNNLESTAIRLRAGFMRLKSVEIGYTIPARHLKKAGISNLRVYVNALNPLLITGKNLGSFDPELTDGTALGYPLSKTYSMGINLSF